MVRHLASMNKNETLRASRRALSTAASVRVHLQGQEHALSPLWLRLNDPARFTPNGQRLFEIADVVQGDDATRVLKSNTCEQEGLHVEWADGTHSSFPTAWLEQHARPQPLTSTEQCHLWNARLERLLPELSYAEFSASEGTLHASSYLARYGLAIVRDVPTEPGITMGISQVRFFVL